MGGSGILLTGILLQLLFAGSGIAIRFVNRIRIEIETRKALLTARILNHFLKNRLTFSAFIQIGKLISGLLVVFGLIVLIHEPGDQEITSTTVFWDLLLAFGGSLLIIPAGTLLAERVFLFRPAEALHLASIPLILLYVVLYLPSRYLALISLKNTGDLKDETAALEAIDLNFLASAAMDQGKNDEEIDADVRIFQNALEFPEVTLKECMIPRTEIISLEIGSSIEELRQLFVQTGLSRIIIYQENIDNILGYVRSIELFRNPSEISAVLATLPFVHENMAANQMLELFIREKRNIAIVLDEFGGTAGLITIEDIIEEIFGEIEDEHDTGSLTAEIRGENEFIFSGRLEIDEINERFKLEIPTSHEYNTLNGFILSVYKDIPEQGEKIIMDQFDIEILKRTETRIELIRLTKKAG